MLVTLAGIVISVIFPQFEKHDGGIFVIPLSMVTDFKVSKHGEKCDFPINLTALFNVRFSSTESEIVPPVPSMVPPRIIKLLQLGI